MARDFDGSADFLTRSDTLGITGYPISFACWANLDDNANWDCFVALNDASSNNPYVALWHRGDVDDKIWMVVSDNSGVGDSVKTAASATMGTWIHCGGKATSSSMTSYLNGTAATPVGHSRGWPTNTDVAGIGVMNRLTKGGHVNGRLAHVAVWDVELSDEDFAALAKGASPLTIRPANLKSYVPVYGLAEPEIDLVGAAWTVTSSPPVAEGPLVADAGPVYVNFTPNPPSGGARTFSRATSSYSQWALTNTDHGINRAINGSSFTSISFWIKPDQWTATGSADDQLISCFNDSGLTRLIIDSGAGAGGVKFRLGARSQDADGFQGITSTTAPTLSVWNHVAARIDWANDDMFLYLNGSEIASSTSLSFGSTTYTQDLGDNYHDTVGAGAKRVTGTWDAESSFDGAMTDFSIWSGDIGTEGIAALNAGAKSLTINPAEIVLHLDMASDGSEIDLINQRVFSEQSEVGVEEGKLLSRGSVSYVNFTPAAAAGSILPAIMQQGLYVSANS